MPGKPTRRTPNIFHKKHHSLSSLLPRLSLSPHQTAGRHLQMPRSSPSALRRVWLVMRTGLSGRGGLVTGQERCLASSHCWIEDLSKVWPDGRIIGSDIISSEIRHLKSSGNWVVIALLHRTRVHAFFFLGILDFWAPSS